MDSRFHGNDDIFENTQSRYFLMAQYASPRFRCLDGISTKKVKREVRCDSIISLNLNFWQGVLFVKHAFVCEQKNNVVRDSKVR